MAVVPIEHLPTRLRPVAERVRDGLLSDAPVLLILGAGILARGLSYSPDVVGPAPSGGGHPAEGLLPIPVWSVIWVAVGVLCLIAAWWPASPVAAMAVGAGVFLHLMWAGSFIYATVIGDSDRGWVSSVGYLTIALLVAWAVWKGTRREVRVREVPDAD